MTYLGEDIPKLGFGLMRLPMIGDDVDIEQTKAMADLFMESGFTYFDTAWGYIDGKSEVAAREAVVERYPRERFQLATKLPAFLAKTAEEARNMFWTSLERTGAGYFDYYLLHNLGDNRTEPFDRFGIWDFVAEQKAAGRIKHVGFSMHDRADALDDILTRHPEMEFVQLQINYADWESHSIESRKCYETARRHGKPVIVMEPVKGGSLANIPENLRAIFERVNPGASPASWGIRFAASLEGLVTVLSGMSTLEQMRDNVAYMKKFQPLNDAERAAVAEVQEGLKDLPSIPCTDCRYCVKGCPQNVRIPQIFAAMNNYLMYGNLAGAKGSYGWETRDGGRSSDCVACGACEQVCPQHIEIIEELKKAEQTLEAKG